VVVDLVFRVVKKLPRLTTPLGRIVTRSLRENNRNNRVQSNINIFWVDCGVLKFGFGLLRAFPTDNSVCRKRSWGIRSYGGPMWFYEKNNCGGQNETVSLMVIHVPPGVKLGVKKTR